MSAEIRELINEIKALWALWSGLMLIVNYLAFLGKLNPNAPDYMWQIFGWFLSSEMESLVFAMLTNPIIEFLRDLGLPI